ncbi:transmembrane protein 42-like [Halichondria panicea]|uniref:transmembrane protein 42-like n=1 Tax=Halichondria panicea TaxID=6063 RepID=UPI00312B6342
MIFTSNSEIMPASGGFSLSVCAGLCAALASVNSKLALDQNGTTIKLAVPCNWLSKQNCFFMVIVLRCVCVILMLVFNAAMWALFVRALNRCSSTVEAAAVNSVSNFFFTAVFGKLLFGEVLALLWWLGASVILFGLVMINYGSSDQVTQQTDKKDR